MDYLDTRRFDRLSEEEVLNRIGSLLAIAVGRSEEQRRIKALANVPQNTTSADSDLAVLGLDQLVTDPLERQIIAHLRLASRANARQVAAALGIAATVTAQKLARLCAAGLCRVEDSSRPVCYRLRSEYTAN